MILYVIISTHITYAPTYIHTYIERSIHFDIIVRTRSKYLKRFPIFLIATSILARSISFYFASVQFKTTYRRLNGPALLDIE